VARSASASIPQIRIGTAEVRGSLSRDMIRRQIQMHRNELRDAYERQLMLNPGLEGRIEIRFMIDTEGRVLSAMVASSTIDNQELERAVLAVFRRMRFPAVEGGGANIITYPVVFRPSEE
jgi:TonB family protein